MPPIISARSLAVAAGILAFVCSSSNAQVYDSCQGAWSRYVVADQNYNKATDEFNNILQQLNEAKPWLNELQLLTAGAKANLLDDAGKVRMKDLEEYWNNLNEQLKASQTKYKETEIFSRDTRQNARADYEGCVREAINRGEQPKPNGQLQQAATQLSESIVAQATAPTIASCPPGPVYRAYRDIGDGDCDPIAAANAGAAQQPPPAIGLSPGPRSTTAALSDKTPTQTQLGTTGGQHGDVVRAQPKAKPKKQAVAKKRIRAPTDEDAPTPAGRSGGADPAGAALVGGIIGTGINIGIGRRW